MMDDLVAWLRAQFDEDERIAQAALWAGDELWRAFHREVDDRWIVADTYDEGVAQMLEQAADGAGLAHHIERWQPAHVLREIDAKRQALDHYLRVRGHAGKHLDYDLAEGAVSVQIRIMALPYSGRPGYREEWRPNL